MLNFKPGPLDEQTVLLTTELFLKPYPVLVKELFMATVTTDISKLI